MAHFWAHARRKLKEVFDRDGSEIAAEGLRRIAEFYAIEAEIRTTSPGQRLSARQARTAPLVAVFGEWLQAERRKISAKSRLGEKLAYIHNHWDGLQTFRFHPALPHARTSRIRCHMTNHDYIVVAKTKDGR